MQHTMKPNFLPIFLLLLLCLLAPAARATGAGVLLEASGSVTAISPDGKTRILQKGSTLQPGDTAITGKDGRAEIRFTDNSLVSLRPESQFRIDEYHYVATRPGKSDGNDKGFFSLVKGGFRTVSGAIGKLQRSNYAVKTPAATIGIRGTEYTAVLESGLHVAVHHGEISLDNRAGSFTVAEGQSAQVANADAPARIFQSRESNTSGNAARNSRTTDGNVQIGGNTRIEAKTDKTTATASGQDNRAVNQAGVIGRD